MRLPPMPAARRKAALALARQPLAAVPVAHLPRVWGMTGDDAESMIAELFRYNMARHALHPEPHRERIILTQFGADVAGVVPDQSGCRWVPAGPASGGGRGDGPVIPVR